LSAPAGSITSYFITIPEKQHAAETACCQLCDYGLLISASQVCFAAAADFCAAVAARRRAAFASSRAWAACCLSDSRSSFSICVGDLRGHHPDVFAGDVHGPHRTN